MPEPTLIRCSRCELHLELEAFAPSHRRTGAWCRACSKAYMADRNATLEATRVRTCKRCGCTFTKWDNYKHGGSARTHCRPCYNAKARERYKPREPRVLKFNFHPTSGRPQGKLWDQLRDRVFAEEPNCWICGDLVDQSIRSGQPDAKTVDHVIPLSHGGHPTDRANLRMAHHRCNAGRGNNINRNPAAYRDLVVDMARAGF